MTGWTQFGRWINSGGVIHRVSDMVLVAIVPSDAGQVCLTQEERPAYSHLIAAAPALLYSCEAILSWLELGQLENRSIWGHEIENLKIAITHARWGENKPYDSDIVQLPVFEPTRRLNLSNE